MSDRLSEIWTFRYKRGMHPVESGHVRAGSKELAWDVATRWCKENGARGPVGDVARFVLAAEGDYEETAVEVEPVVVKEGFMGRVDQAVQALKGK